MSAAEVIAEAISRHLPQSRGAGRWPGCHSHPTVMDYTPEHVADVVLAAIRAMTVEQQAEVIGGEVQRFTTLKPHRDAHPFCIPRTCPHREYDQHQERVVGPWREVQP